MQITWRRIASAVMLLGCFVSSYQILSRPQPLTLPQNPSLTRANAASFDQKLEQLAITRTLHDPPAEVHFTSEEVNAEIAQSTSSPPPAGADSAKPEGATSPDATVGAGAVQVKGYQVKLEGDVAWGQFVTEIAGKDVYVTLAGHLGSQDGYVRFDPVEFKIGDLTIPVSLVNSALQKKLAEQREQLKLPEGVASLRVENGQLVITQK
jgi:hypothetical protein